MTRRYGGRIRSARRDQKLAEGELSTLNGFGYLRNNQEAGNDKEDVDADITARDARHADVAEHDGKN